jgi:nicotinamidase-related amidase
MRSVKMPQAFRPHPFSASGELQFANPLFAASNYNRRNPMKTTMSQGIWDASECALILIDYQPEMFQAVRSMNTTELEKNIVALTKTAVAFEIPIILSTVGVKMGVNQPTIEALSELIPKPAIDRSSMNAWEDKNFLQAVKASGRKRLVFGALWTEICLAFPVVDALKDGYEVAIVADAVGGESKEEHDTAILRMIHAGAVPNTTTAMIAEWFRDWKSPLAKAGREILVPHLRERHAMHRAPRSAGQGQTEMRQ